MKNFLIASILSSLLFLSACNIADSSDSQKENLQEVKSYFKDSTTVRILWEYPANDSTTILVSHFYKNGKLQMKGNIVGGVRDGKWVAWDDQGRMLSTGHYQDGFENGMWTVWFPSGQKRYEGLFKDGKRTGIWKFYDEQGKLVKEIEY